MAIHLDEIQKEWKIDSVINPNDLDVPALAASRLHAKYIQYMTEVKLAKTKAELDLKQLAKDKWLWYEGKMDQKEIDDKGWKYDGLKKPLKGDMDYYYESDIDIQKAQAKIQYYQITIDTLKEILDSIRWRNQAIKNAIEWRKFVSGC